MSKHLYKDYSTGMCWREYKQYVIKRVPDARVYWVGAKWIVGVVATDSSYCYISKVRKYPETAWKSAYLELKKLDEKDNKD